MSFSSDPSIFAIEARAKALFALEDDAKEKRQCLLEAIKADGSLIADRSYFFRTYPSCFVGRQAVDFALKNGHAKSRREATELLQAALGLAQIHHVCGEHDFEDEELFYRFREDESKERMKNGPSAPSLFAIQGLVKTSGWLMKSSTLFWRPIFAVLIKDGSQVCGSSCKGPQMICYKSEAALFPICSYDMSSSTFSVSYCSKCDPSLFGFSIRVHRGVTNAAGAADGVGALAAAATMVDGRDRVKSTEDRALLSRTFSCATADQQDKWIQNCVSIGARFCETDDEALAETAKSAFEFTVMDCRGEAVSLGERYGEGKCKALLIVNVASY